MPTGLDALASDFEAVLHLPAVVAAAVLGGCERHVDDEAVLGVLAGGDAVEHLYGDAAFEQIVEEY